MGWIYEGKELLEVPDGYMAFVYLITNKLTGKRYIGKKLFYFSKQKTVKGKKKRTKVESDWNQKVHRGYIIGNKIGSALSRVKSKCVG